MNKLDEKVKMEEVFLKYQRIKKKKKKIFIVTTINIMVTALRFVQSRKET